MPVMPSFENDVAAEGQAPVIANPQAFARTGAALAQGGREVSDQMAAFQDRYIEAQRAVTASNTIADLGKQIDDLQHKYSLVPNRTQAMAGYNSDVANLMKQNVDTIADPFVQAHVREQVGSYALTQGDAVGKQSFDRESSQASGDLLRNLQTFSTQAARAPNDAARAIVTDNAMAAIHGAAAGGWITPEATAQLEIKWASDVQAVHVRDQMAQYYNAGDADGMEALANRVLDTANYPGMTQDERVELANSLSTKAYRLELRASRIEAHNDAMADRNYHMMQAHNEAVLLAGLNAGTAQLSDAQIAQMADRQQISAGGVEALHAARDRAEDGRDDPLTAAHLWDAIGNHNATTNDVYGLFQQGRIAKSTMIDAVKAIDAKNSKDDPADKANYNVLKTALSGAAVESGNLFGDKSGATANWAQAQGEWTRRVTIGGEDSAAVLSDMIPRYSTAFLKPTWLAPTKYGTPASTKDVMAAAAKLAADYRNKQISQSEFQAQAELLTDYKRFYALEDERAGARAKATSRARAAGGGAQLVGVTPGASE